MAGLKGGVFLALGSPGRGIVFYLQPVNTRKLRMRIKDPISHMKAYIPPKSAKPLTYI